MYLRVDRERLRVEVNKEVKASVLYHFIIHTDVS